MTKCKAIHYLAVATIVASAFPNIAQAESIPFKEYMQRKRNPQAYQDSAPLYNAPQYSAPQYSAPQYSAPAPQYQPPAQQYAMRPPAPYNDTSVPQAQQEMRRPVMNQQQYQAPMQNSYTLPPMPERAAASEAEKEKVLGGEISGSLGLTSDYVFRGISQTKEGPAVQGGIEYQHDIGAYIGLWGSNVDFTDADEAQTEFDIYGGYRTALTDELSVDVGGLYYIYPGANDNLNYNYGEVYASGEYSIPVGLGAGTDFALENATIGAALYYTPEYFGEADAAYYVKGTAAAPFANGITLDGHVGKQWFKDNTLALLPDYVDWSVGIAYALPQEFGVKLEYTDTNIDEVDCPDGCDGKAVATLSKSF